jgi:putative PIG3 family NAD(P)H quinone oxidoreductase
MATTRVIRIANAGGPEVLTPGELPQSPPGPEEVLIRVAASGVNRADLLQRRGLYPAPEGVPADIPGLEVSGTIAAVGRDVRRWREGDAVMAVLGGGGYADHVLLHQRLAVRAPHGLSLTQAAGIPEAFSTAYDALVHQLAMRPCEELLVHAAGSGVGTAAVQLGRTMGLRTLGTTRSAGKLERVRGLGLDAGWLADDAWVAKVLAATEDRGVAAVLDLVGGATVADNLRALAPLGRLLVVGLLGGRKATLDLGVLLAKRLTVRGTVLRNRPFEEKVTLAQDLDLRLVPQFEAGKLVPVIDQAFPAAQVAAAHTYLETNQSFGKVLLVWD